MLSHWPVFTIQMEFSSPYNFHIIFGLMQCIIKFLFICWFYRFLIINSFIIPDRLTYVNVTILLMVCTICIIYLSQLLMAFTRAFFFKITFIIYNRCYFWNVCLFHYQMPIKKNKVRQNMKTSIIWHDLPIVSIWLFFFFTGFKII